MGRLDKTHHKVVLEATKPQHSLVIYLSKDDLNTRQNILSLKMLENWTIKKVTATPPQDTLIREWQDKVAKGYTLLSFEQWKEANNV